MGVDRACWVGQEEHRSKSEAGRGIPTGVKFKSWSKKRQSVTATKRKMASQKWSNFSCQTYSETCFSM
jgi:hypothetical protein